ncbi:MAG: hypothetical protein WA839_02830 [Flavobacteriaceae bacterium]|tara:strand:- start:3366 stop:3947 length:582 start_codon:yes stop_codon:yes gene_type:complete
MKTLVTILILTLSSLAFTQNLYLKISEENKMSVSYPPETKFELKNKHGYIILKESKIPLVYKIEEPYTLTVFPSYKNEKDIFKLTNGKIEIVSNKEYMDSIKNKNKKISSHSVTGEKIITNSKTIKGFKNIVFKLSNGITFQYTDGKYNAFLVEEENYLNIEGRYVIKSELGTLKLSFNPKNAETWWVFNPEN